MAKSGSIESACIVNAGAEKRLKKGLVYRSTAIFPCELTKVRSSGCDLFCFFLFRFFKLATSAAAPPSLIIDFICLPNFATCRDISQDSLYDIISNLYINN